MHAPEVDNEVSATRRLMASHIYGVKKTMHDLPRILVSICKMQVNKRYNSAAQRKVHAYFQSYRKAFHNLGYNGMTCLFGEE